MAVSATNTRLALLVLLLTSHAFQSELSGRDKAAVARAEGLIAKARR
jgi:hypothetical protein